MGIKSRRRNFRLGGSLVISLPRELNIGKETTLAADTLILADPTGRISEDELHEFLETQIEPIFWEWLKKKGLNLAERKED